MLIIKKILMKKLDAIHEQPAKLQQPLPAAATMPVAPMSYADEMASVCAIAGTLGLEVRDFLF